MRFPRQLTGFALLAFGACSLLPDVRVGPNEGVPPVGGVTEVSLENFVCGQPIAAGSDTATTRKVEGGCELSFTQEVQVLDDADYEQISQLSSVVGLLEAIELEVTKFDLIDAVTNEVIDPQARLISAALSVNGQVLADKPVLTSLPRTVRLSGEALEPIKQQMSQRLPVSLIVSAVVVMPDEPPLPKALRLEYDAQPTLVLSL